ncbi:MAG: hypothetical protein ACRDV9_03595 [Acidimicrobiia bacterium]
MRPVRPSELVGPGLCVLGLAFVLVGWNGAAGSNRLEAQFPYLISGGVFGLCLVVIGTGLVVAGALKRLESAAETRSEELRRSFEDVLRAVAVGVTGSEADSGIRDSGIRDSGIRVTVLNATYHEPSCRVLDGRSGLRRVAPSAAASLGFSPCRVCQADPEVQVVTAVVVPVDELPPATR